MARTLNSNKKMNTIKFLYSYGGKIVPRELDGELRYAGGHTRVLAVNRSISFSELMVKFEELCGSSMSLKCKLPNEDLDVQVSITSDEDLCNVTEEYDRISSEMKVRAVLFPMKPLKAVVSCPPSPVSSSSYTSSASISPVAGFYSPPSQHRRGGLNFSPERVFSAGVQNYGRCYFRRFGCEQVRSRHLCSVPQWHHCH